MSDGSIFGPILHGGEPQRKAKKFVYVLVQIYFYSASFGLKMVQKFSKNGQLSSGNETFSASDHFLKFERFL